MGNRLPTISESNSSPIGILRKVWLTKSALNFFKLIYIVISSVLLHNRIVQTPHYFKTSEYVRLHGVCRTIDPLCSWGRRREEKEVCTWAPGPGQHCLGTPRKCLCPTQASRLFSLAKRMGAILRVIGATRKLDFLECIWPFAKRVVLELYKKRHRQHLDF